MEERKSAHESETVEVLQRINDHVVKITSNIAEINKKCKDLEKPLEDVTTVRKSWDHALARKG